MPVQKSLAFGFPSPYFGLGRSPSVNGGSEIRYLSLTRLLHRRDYGKNAAIYWVQQHTMPPRKCRNCMRPSTISVGHDNFDVVPPQKFW